MPTPNPVLSPLVLFWRQSFHFQDPTQAAAKKSWLNRGSPKLGRPNSIGAQTIVGYQRSLICKIRAPAKKGILEGIEVRLFQVHSRMKSESGGLWHVGLPSTRRPARFVFRGVTQRLKIKGLKFFRFSDHRLFLPVGVVRCD